MAHGPVNVPCMPGEFLAWGNALSMPYAASPLIYTGEEQSPSWVNYDPDKFIIGGETSGINAGSYTASFTPRPGYEWSGGGNAPRYVGWIIDKAQGSLSLDKNEMSFDAPGASDTAAVTKAGDGTVTAISSDTGVATVNVNVKGTIVEVKVVASGTATITVNVAEGTNHTVPDSASIDVTADIEQPHD